MTLQELYAQVGGDYQQVIGRLRMDSLVSRFVVRFLDDTTCKDLIDAWGRGDEKAAFAAAHTAKGLCANLSLNELARLSSEICEALRPGNDELRAQTDVDALVTQLADSYATAIDAIGAYAASL